MNAKIIGLSFHFHFIVVRRFSNRLSPCLNAPNKENLPPGMLTDNILDLIGRTPLVRLKNEPIFA